MKKSTAKSICAVEACGQMPRLSLILGLFASCFVNSVMANPCKVGSWSSWSECIVRYAACRGSSRRTRTIIEHPGPGEKCPFLEEERPCMKLNCNVFIPTPSPSTIRFNPEANHTFKIWPTPAPKFSIKCEMSKWEPWSACTKTCGKGVQRRTRSIIRLPTVVMGSYKKWQKHQVGFASKKQEK